VNGYLRYGDDESLLIREIIVENFMSYKYARIPFNSGLNIVCGPNGSGKSSILLAISVALGQAYTERAKKLSDLIRWGEDTARVTLVFDNKPQSAGRPVPKFDADSFRLSRYLNRDGNYWYETNFQTVNKSEVTETLRTFGLNPDNMLIIMHQHMMVEFGIITPQKKLLMVEEAVGLREYRFNVLEAQQKLTQVLSEEESVATLLKNAEQTLDYWRNEYERYQRRRELLVQRDFFERELAWAQLIRQEEAIAGWKDKIQIKESELDHQANEINENENVLQEFQEKLDRVRQERNDLHDALLAFEREKTGVEETISGLRKTLDSITAHLTAIAAGFDEAASSREVDDPAERLDVDQDDALVETASLEQESAEGFDVKPMLERRLQDLQTRVQLLKQEADKLAAEQALLTTLLKDKEDKESTVQRERERLDELSRITDQISLNLDAWSEGKKQIALAEARWDSLKQELYRFIKRLPPTIAVQAMDNPVELAGDVAHRLQSEITARETVRERRTEVDAVVQTLSSEEQTVVTAIQVGETEINRLNTHYAEVSHYLDGRRDTPQIRCDKCGSLLASDQWVRHLEEIGAQRTEAEGRLTTRRHDLQDLQRQLADKRNEQQQLHREEQMLETIRPLSMQALQLDDALQKAEDILNQHRMDCKRIATDLAAAVDVDEPPHELDAAIERRAQELQAEAHTLQLDIPRLEATIATFDALHIQPQQERVETAQRATEQYQTMLPQVIRACRRYLATLESQLQAASQKKLELDEQVSTAQAELTAVETQSTALTDGYQDARARKVLLEFQMKTAKSEVDKLTTELARASRELEQIRPQVEGMGERVETDRNPTDISADIKVTNAHLALLKDVSADVENMYLSYLNLFNELKEKVSIVTENREQALQEVEERKNVWRTLLQALLDDVNPIFKAFLEKIGATGWVSVVNTEDFEEAGLELTVGFRGAEPHVLDAQTQSGGERSSATMAFLLALQRHIKSPFRAVDEFDVHMDPRNREIISQMLLMEMEKETESQYLIITPGQLTSVSDDVHVITVQKVQDTSEIKVVSEPLQAV
jgi:chromosome segregation ATPase